LLHYLGKLKIQIFCKYSADMEKYKQIIASNFVVHPQILIFWVSRKRVFPILIAIKFSVSLCSFTCLLLRSDCGTGSLSQQMSLQCLSTINMAFRDEDQILIEKHINTLSIYCYAHRGIKIGALKMQFLCNFSIPAEYLQKI